MDRTEGVVESPVQPAHVKAGLMSTHDLLKSLPLQLAQNGVYYVASREEISYPAEGNDLCFEVEDQSFWFRHRNACIVEMVKKFPPREGGHIFDVGGGNGFVAKGLMDAGWEVVLIEPGPAGARNAKRRGLPHVVCATTQVAGFDQGSMPAIGVFDVVEHMEDDRAFLRHLWDLLEKDGMLYLSVPAFQFLWSHEDIDAGHFRRYSLPQICRKLTEAGFRIEFDTYIFGVLPLFVFAFRTLPYRLGLSRPGNVNKGLEKDHVMKESFATSLLNKALGWDISLIKKGSSSRVGGSCMVAARKIDSRPS